MERAMVFMNGNTGILLVSDVLIADRAQPD
jgi:hypothetical protein